VLDPIVVPRLGLGGVARYRPEFDAAT
jgi:hypothetical protein